MKGSKKVFTVNRLLSLLFFVMLLPFMLVSLWSFDYIQKDNINTFENNLSRFTHNTAMESVNRQLEEIGIVFQILNSRITPNGAKGFIEEDHDTLNAILASIVNTLTFFDAAIISDIHDHYRIYPKIQLKGFVPSQRPWYPGIKQKNGIHYSEPYNDLLPDLHNSNNQSVTITVSMDLFDEELLKYGNIAFDLDLYSMSTPLQDIVTPFEGKFLVAAQDGTVIMHSNFREIFHQKIPQRWIDKAIDLEGNFYDAETEKFIFYHSFSDPYWVAFTIVDKEMYDDYIGKAPQTLIIIISLCLVIYTVLVCLCRVYIKSIISRLYMGVNGINVEEQEHNLERVYNNIKKSHLELEEARKISGEDALTGVGSRRNFDTRLDELIAHNEPFYLAILDLDNFKSINDAFGHVVGDSVLKYVSNAGKAILEPKYHIYRFGGEELVALFPGNDYEEYFNLMETWRQVISQRQWRETTLSVTFSCGIAKWKEGETAQDVIIKADKTLYAAKQSGKNVILSSCD